MIIRDKVRQNLARLTLFTLLLTGMSLALAACGGDTTGSAAQSAATAVTSDTSSSAATPTPEMAMDDPAAPTAAPSDSSGQAAVTPAAASDTGSTSGTTEVQATLREWAIDLSQSEVPAGKVRFTVTNAGMMRHNFTIQDANGDIAQTPTFAGSEGAQKVEVDLKPGTYTIICSLPGHAQRGQKTQLVVK